MVRASEGNLSITQSWVLSYFHDSSCCWHEHTLIIWSKNTSLYLPAPRFICICMLTPTHPLRPSLQTYQDMRGTENLHSRLLRGFSSDHKSKGAQKVPRWTCSQNERKVCSLGKSGRAQKGWWGRFWVRSTASLYSLFLKVRERLLGGWRTLQTFKTEGSFQTRGFFSKGFTE